MPKTDQDGKAIEQSVQVECEIEEAFRLFTEELDGWWPLASYSVEGENAHTCIMEPWAGGRVFERSRSGDEHEWGTVITWDPPHRVVLRWHPGQTDEHDDQQVDVRFDSTRTGTQVTVIHSGWDRAGVAVCLAGRGWTGHSPALVVERCFVEFANTQLAVMF
jgi:uncharacterized protein YndB with AHSA1/START domain